VDGQTIGLRERTRRAVRAELIAEAMALFLDKGFEATTVEDIAVAAGLSRRSYFRYFASKDEVLAEGLAEVGRAIADSVASRPDSESPWTALRRGFDSLIDQAERYPRTRDMGSLMIDGPAIEASHQNKMVRWQASIAEALATRLPEGTRNAAFVASSIAAAGLGCFNVAQDEWRQTDNPVSLGALTDAAMTALQPLNQLPV
jgi:AcrR family transcriptional regulator